jgi:hypothetical protein
VKGGDRTFEYKMNNKNGSKPMSYKQENYVRNLLKHEMIINNYPDYVGYIQKLLFGNSEITVKQASFIIDTLKEMIDIEKAKKNGDNDDVDEAEETIE